MALTKTPICDFGKKAENFNLVYFLDVLAKKNDSSYDVYIIFIEFYSKR